MVRALADYPEWAGYAEYCKLLERGLRKKALAELNRFISSQKEESFEERKRFASWLCTHVSEERWMNQLLPHPLWKEYVELTLNEWIQVEPTDSEPYRWLGGYDNLKRAVELNPQDEIARASLIRCILGHVGYATHELPSGYLGIPEDDRNLLIQAEELLGGISNPERRKKFSDAIHEERSEVERYLTAQQQRK